MIKLFSDITCHFPSSLLTVVVYMHTERKKNHFSFCSLSTTFDFFFCSFSSVQLRLVRSSTYLVLNSSIEFVDGVSLTKYISEGFEINSSVNSSTGLNILKFQFYSRNNSCFFLFGRIFINTQCAVKNKVLFFIFIRRKSFLFEKKLSIVCIRHYYNNNNNCNQFKRNSVVSDQRQKIPSLPFNQFC